MDLNFSNLKDMSNLSLEFGEQFQSMGFAATVTVLARNELQMNKGNKCKIRNLTNVEPMLHVKLHACGHYV